MLKSILSSISKSSISNLSYSYVYWLECKGCKHNINVNRIKEYEVVLILSELMMFAISG